jgi:hypothetical protein
MILAKPDFLAVARALCFRFDARRRSWRAFAGNAESCRPAEEPS